MRVADLELDYDLLPEVVRIADCIESAMPERIAPLISRWIKAGVEYANV
jgi:hypothetical protein